MLDRETLNARLDNHEEISVSTLAKKNKLLFHFLFVSIFVLRAGIEPALSQ